MTLQKIIDALLAAIPSIGNVVVVTFLIYFLFGILGLNLFLGKLWYCEDQYGNRMDPRQYPGLVIDKEWCEDNGGQHLLLCPESAAGSLQLFRGRHTGPGRTSWDCDVLDPGQRRTNSVTRLVETFGQRYLCTPDMNTTGVASPVVSLCPPVPFTHRWRNNPSNFDNVGYSILCLFEMASQESWTDVQYATAAAVGLGKQPIRGHNPAAMIFSMVYMIVGSFILINLLVGVTIEQFYALQEESEGRALLTDAQEQWRTITKMMLTSCPKVAAIRPSGGLPRIAFRLVQTRSFEIFIVICIGANTARRPCRSWPRPCALDCSALARKGKGSLDSPCAARLPDNLNSLCAALTFVCSWQCCCSTTGLRRGTWRASPPPTLPSP